MHAGEQWLVRTADNRISGPFAKDQLRELLQAGKLGLRDEVCPENGHWIFLHEKEEVARQLGQDALQWLIPSGFRGDEATQTQTEPGLEPEHSSFAATDEGEAQTTVIRRLKATSPKSTASLDSLKDSMNSMNRHVPIVISAFPGTRLKWMVAVLVTLLLFLVLSRT